MIENLGLACLHRLDPENAHKIAMWGIRSNLLPSPGPIRSSRLATNIAGITLANPVGLAAGFDKNAEAVNPLSRSGFGFIEVGAATPRPQQGNPKPRLFRLTEERAAINRFGFNNRGAEDITQRLRSSRPSTPVGLNLGANKDSEDRASDFAKVLSIAGPYIDFATVNVSSPNTEKLRDLQGPEALRALIEGVMKARNSLETNIPIFLKIAPDLSAEEIAAIVETAIDTDISAIIATNTTLDRTGLWSPNRNEAGGLSGAPLFEKSTRTLAQVSRIANGRMPIIGVGGIGSTEDALEKIRAGASVVQLYTAMVFKGLSLGAKIARGIDTYLAEAGIDNVSQLVGTGRDRWL